MWSNGSTATILNNLTAGTYSVTVTDGNGCQGIDSVVVNQTDPNFIFNIVATDEFCVSSNGTISIQAMGGTGPYTFDWSNGSFGAFIGGLSTGTYTVTATDVNGCSDTTSVFVDNECPCTTPAIEKITLLPATCPDNDGEATIEVVGTEADFTFIWSPDIGTPMWTIT
ncbi:MAG: hypothetical protein R2784_08115 [Saprospiraceae bacterium]